MTVYEILTSLIAVVALLLSTLSLVRGRKAQAKQLDFQAITAALEIKQLELLEKVERTDKREDVTGERRDKRPHVTAELVKVGRTDYRFVIMNQGSAVALDVTFEIDPASPDNPLVKNDCQRKLPYPSLQPAQSFTLIAALHMGSAMVYETHLKWRNPDGSAGTNDVHLST